MPGIKDAATEFAAFTAALSTERRELIDSIAVLNNGFEGWLKLEFYFWLIKNGKLQASMDVGMEYKVSLDQRYGAMDRETKQCDLWVRDHLEAGYHYIELKAPFANTGVFQGSCRVDRVFYAASSSAGCSRSGLSMTAPMGSQLRVLPDQRLG